MVIKFLKAALCWGFKSRAHSACYSQRAACSSGLRLGAGKTLVPSFEQEGVGDGKHVLYGITFLFNKSDDKLV